MKFKVVFLFVLVLSCTQKTVVSDTILNYLPQNATAILKVNNLSNFKSELKNGAFFSKTENLALSKSIREKVNSINFLNPSAKCVVGFYEQGRGKYEFVFVSDTNLNFFKTDLLENESIETIKYENKEIKKYTLKNNTLFIATIENKAVASSSKLLIENILRSGINKKVSPKLRKLFDTSDITKSATIITNLKHSNGLVSSNLKNGANINITGLADWMSLDLTSDANKTTLNGIVISNDSIKNFINLFKSTNPLPEKVSTIAPQNTEAIIAYSFNNYDVFATNQEKYLDKIQKKDSLFNTIEEVGVFYMNNEKGVSLNSFGADNLISALDKLGASSSTYQDVEIKILNDKNFISNAFNPLVTDFESNFYIVLENTFVFASTKEFIQNVIANTKSGTTFNNTEAYYTVKSNLANESSILFIANHKGINHFLDANFSSELFNDVKKTDLKDYAFAAQMVADTDFYHVNMVTAVTQKEIKTNAIGPLFTVELDTDIAKNPQFVKNHRNNNYEIAVQDKNNILYLIDINGKTLWKKQLDGQIQGQIQQVDLYKNGKLQLAFCTNNQFLILDRNGENVLPLNKTYEGGNLNALAVFDYENNKNYRFLVTQGRKIFMYNSQGTIVDAFTYKEAEKSILKAPKHFKISKKDYLVFLLEDNTVAIRHRAGQERIKVSRTIDFSDNDLFLYKNKFSITDKKGVLHQIDTNGKLSATNFNLGKEHGMYATSKTLALMNENTLSIKGKKIELELGIYTKPKIFYINDKIYVSVTDIQNQKIYLFDSQAKAISNFPVYGNSLIDLIDMDGDKKLELVAKDQENSIIVYKMN